MSTLILPVAGKSSRFPGMRPKWLLTMPDGCLMFEKALSQFDLTQFERVVLVCLKEHLDNYISEVKLRNILQTICPNKIDICILNQPTSSQSQSVVMAIKNNNIVGSIYIKDCDNTFLASYNGGNEIAVFHLSDIGLVDAKNKSYVSVDSLGNVLNIVEKQVISNSFCCGGYGFNSAEMFIKSYDSIHQSGEIYISHVIFKMILDGDRFSIHQASNYIDWGTLKEYQNYCNSFITIFCDVDGVLFYNGSKFGSNGWRTEPIAENLIKLANIQKKGKLYLIITSSRPLNEIDYIKSRLSEHGIVADNFLMGLPHTKRLLINDYSLTNPYPSAICVNLQRDSKDLSQVLDQLLG
jgi:hypothetical protein